MVNFLTGVPWFRMLTPTSCLLPLAIFLLLVGCTSGYSRLPATSIHENVHTGGSLVRFNSEGSLLVSGGWEGRVVLWSLPDGARVRAWQAHEGSVNGAAFVGGGDELVTAGYDSRLVRWSPAGQVLRERYTPSPVLAMAASRDGDLLLTGHADGALRTWTARDLAAVGEYGLYPRPIKAVALDETSGAMAASGAAGEVALVMADGEIRHLPPGPTDTWTLAFSPDGRVLMGAGWFRLHRWRLPAGELTTLPTEHHGIIKSVHYSADGRTLVSISRQTDSAVNFLDPDTGATLRRFQRHALCGGDVRLSPDGDFLASTADDASVRIWDLRE